MNGSGYEAEVVTMLQLKVRMLMFLGLAAMARFVRQSPCPSLLLASVSN